MPLSALRARLSKKKNAFLANWREEKRVWRHFTARRRTERMIASLVKGRPCLLEGEVLADGTWDNPHYWLRLGLTRAALGIPGTRMSGYIGESNRSIMARSFRRFGVSNILDLPAIAQAHREASLAMAKDLLAKAKGPGDILNWKLPFDFPAAYLYDNILKKQRRGSVDLKDPNVVALLARSLAYIFAADEVLSSRSFKLVLLSHAITAMSGPIAWIAAQRGIPTYVLVGNVGIAQFWRVEPGSGIYELTQHPSGELIDSLPDWRAEALGAAGRAYLAMRARGKTDDIGNVYANIRRSAYVDRRQFLDEFGWSGDKPRVAIYSANLFDYPHCGGMSHFRDFEDWLLSVLEVARSRPDVNWLFKAHPVDEWYRGVQMADLLGPLEEPHIRLVPHRWNNAAILDNVDAVVTYHGTIGVEAAAKGVPVLASDRGWYHDAGFAIWPKSRQEFLDHLGRDWWKGVDIEECRRRAEIFAGFVYCCPDWQQNFILRDDVGQYALYADLPGRLARSRKEIEIEFEEIAQWIASGERYLHIRKMLRAKAYTLTNVH